MLGDSATMFVDAFTYMFNLYAEREKGAALKPSPLQKAKLELIPPTISVVALISVTTYVSAEAIRTIHEYNVGPEDTDPSDDANTTYMLIFSSINLLIDFLNMGCFASASRLFGYDLKPHCSDCPDQNNCDCEDEPQGSGDEKEDGNMNMCSAYTHVFADTLRSLAVMIAALLSVFAGYDGDLVDAVAALVVSVIIVVSLFPLLSGLRRTMGTYRSLKAEEEAGLIGNMETASTGDSEDEGDIANGTDGATGDPNSV